MEATGTQPAIIESPLSAHHKSSGANIATWFACSLPNDFGDWQLEYEIAKNSVGLIDKNYLAYFSFTGPDRARYLNAILTNNIKDLQPGQGNVSLLLNPQGRILAEIETQSEPERLLCISHAMIRSQLAEILEKFIIMDDVALTDETDRYGTLSLQGPETAQFLRDLAPQVNLDSLVESSFVETKLGSIAATITKHSFANTVAADIRVNREHLGQLWTLLSEKSLWLNGPVGYKALNALRLEQSIPWFGYDFGDKQIPHEAGLENSHISYTKGCYTGQEIVERVRSRGQVNRRRVSLRFPNTTEPPPAATILTADSKEVGAVTSSSPLPRQPDSIGMAYVRKESAAPATELSFTTPQTSGKATVI
jgi:folate-binding protein YgfZ